MKVSLYDNKGKKTTKSVDLAPSVFEQKVNKALINQALYVYGSNQRQSNAHTKDRGDVSGGGKKPWKQKGTGRARAGSSRSPIWTGGGVTFGPKNERNYKKDLTRKMKKGAIRSAFSHLASEGKVVVMEKIGVGKEGLAKTVDQVVKNLKLGKKVLLVQKTVDRLLTKTVNNIKDLEISHVGELNIHKILTANTIVFFDEALEDIEKFWGGVAKKAVVATKKADQPKADQPVAGEKIEKAVKKTAPKKPAAKKAVAKKTTKSVKKTK